MSAIVKVPFAHEEADLVADLLRDMIIVYERAIGAAAISDIEREELAQKVLIAKAALAKVAAE